MNVISRFKRKEVALAVLIALMMVMTLVAPVQYSFAEGDADSTQATEQSQEANNVSDDADSTKDEDNNSDDSDSNSGVNSEATTETESVNETNAETEAEEESVSLMDDESSEDHVIVWLRGHESKQFQIDGFDNIEGPSKGTDILSYTITGQQAPYTLTITGNYQGQDTLKVNGVTYEVRVYTPMYVRMIDVTDSDNPIEINGMTLITRYWLDDNNSPASWENEYGSSIGAQLYATIAKGYNYEGQAYEYVYGETDYYGEIYVWEFYFTQDQSSGDKVLTYEDDDENAPVAFKDFVDKDGNPATGLEGTPYVLTRGKAIIDGKRVWCVEPLVGTYAGSKYEIVVADENIRAALTALFGSDETDVERAITQALIWEAVGYDGISNNPVRVVPSYDPNNPFSELELTEEEKTAVADLKARINEAIEFYENNVSAGFESATDGVTVENGQIIINKAKIPTTIVLKANNTALLKYYADGNIKYPNGITGVVNKDAGTVTLTIDKDALEEGSSISFSMIPEDFSKETNKYVSSTGRQELMEFGIANPRSEELTIALVEMPDEEEPETPDEDSEEPEDSEDNDTEESKDKDNEVNTGDSSDAMNMWILLMIMSGAGIAVATRRFTKN